MECSTGHASGCTYAYVPRQIAQEGDIAYDRGIYSVHSKYLHFPRNCLLTCSLDLIRLQNEISEEYQELDIACKTAARINKRIEDKFSQVIDIMQSGFQSYGEAILAQYQASGSIADQVYHDIVFPAICDGTLETLNPSSQTKRNHD